MGQSIVAIPVVQMHRLAGASSVIHWHWKWPLALWPSAPGNKSVRVSTWKPLQMPITGFPAADEGAQHVADPVFELQREHPPGAQRVGVAEAAGDHHHLSLVEHCRAVDRAPTAG